MGGDWVGGGRAATADAAVEFITRLGCALLDAGAPTSTVGPGMQQLAHRFDLDCEITVLPNGVLAVNSGTGRSSLVTAATRVDVGGRAFDQDEPNTANAGRVLPIPDALLTELAAARSRQAAEKLALGEAYSELGYVVYNEAGEPYHPSTLSTLWQAAIRTLAVPQIRLHDARHTCATLMHLQGVPIALVAAWLGHADVSFTMRTYVHAQPEALELAARSFAPPMADSGD